MKNFSQILNLYLFGDENSAINIKPSEFNKRRAGFDRLIYSVRIKGGTRGGRGGRFALEDHRVTSSSSSRTRVRERAPGALILFLLHARPPRAM